MDYDSYGLSYTSFRIKDIDLKKKKDGVEVTAVVGNTGNVPGKEAVQLYVSGDFKDCPCQGLKGFEKTRLLGAGEKEQVRIQVPWKAFAVYDEGQAAWKIMQGTYALYLGASSRDTECIGQVHVEQEILTGQCCCRLSVLPCNQGKIQFLSSSGQKRQGRKDALEQAKAPKRIVVTAEDVKIEAGNAKGAPAASRNGEKGSLKGLSVEELAALCVGYGPGTPFSAIGDTSDPPTIYDEKGEPVTTNSHPTGFPGYVSPAIEDKNIFSVFYKDGPAGISNIFRKTLI